MDDFFATLTPWWPPGREDLHWHLLPDRARLAAELTGPYQELTHLPGLAPVDPRWCHITVRDIAPAEAISPAELDSLIARTRQSCRAVRPAEYRPHLTLAYGVARTGDDPLQNWLATHPARTMTFTATHLALVAQSHDGARAITWRPITTVALTGPG